MTIFTTCSACAGGGTVECRSCPCTNCKATGRVDQTCPACHGRGKQACGPCNQSGRVVAKKGFFRDTYKPCGTCAGSGKSPCGQCTKGIQLNGAQCPSCAGKGRAPSCDRCRGSGRAACSKCAGKGRFEGEWFGTLRQMSRDRLTHEYSKRQNRISVLEMKYSQLESRHEAINQQWAEESRHLNSARAFRDYTPPSFADVESDMAEVSEELANVRAQLEAIERVMYE